MALLRFRLVPILAALLLPLAALPASAQREGDRYDRDRDRGDRWEQRDQGQHDARDPDGWRDRWMLLGTETVGFQAETDTIKIDPHEGRFRNIAFVVRRGDVYVHGLRVWFGNGEQQTFSIREEYSAGGRTGPLELEREHRIERIQLMYKAVDGGRRGGPAVVEIWGERGSEHRRYEDRPAVAPVPPPPPPHHHHRAEWVQIACEKVAFLNDHDVVRVGREAGRFSALKLTITGTKVDVHRMRVIFANGEEENLLVEAEIKSGADSAALPLRGGHRAIDRIVLDYAAKPSFKGEATACVFGQPD